MFSDLIVILAGYLAGALPFGVWVVRVARGEDLREHGSGNIGASNVWRVFGRKLGLTVALLDVAKGFVPTLVALQVGGDLLAVLTGAAAMAGHARPVFLRFERGGKMVATAGGVGFAVAPIATLACAAVWLIVCLATRYASVASLAAAASLPVFSVLLGASPPVLVFTSLAFVAVVILHRENIARLMRGEEARLRLSRVKAKAARA